MIKFKITMCKIKWKQEHSKLRDIALKGPWWTKLKLRHIFNIPIKKSNEFWSKGPGSKSHDKNFLFISYYLSLNLPIKLVSMCTSGVFLVMLLLLSLHGSTVLTNCICAPVILQPVLKLEGLDRHAVERLQNSSQTTTEYSFSCRQSQKFWSYIVYLSDCSWSGTCTFPKLFG